MKKLLLVCFYFSFSSAAFSQIKYTILKDRILEADTVIIIECRNKQGMLVIDSSFLGRTNDSIILKKGKIVNLRQKKQLANIIARPDFPKGRFASKHPYSPDQIIFLKHKSYRSFIETGSRKIIPSHDFGVASFTIDVQKEIDFDNFCYKIGLKR